MSEPAVELANATEETIMFDVSVPEGLWQTSILPEGILERWLVVDGGVVAVGQALAAVRVGESLHDILSPRAGRLKVVLASGCIVEPGTVIGEIGGSS